MEAPDEVEGLRRVQTTYEVILGYRVQGAQFRQTLVANPPTPRDGRQVCPAAVGSDGDTRGCTSPVDHLLRPTSDTPGLAAGRGRFKLAGLSALTGWYPKTVKRAVRSLIEAGWVAIRRENRLPPIHLTPQHPGESRKRGVQARLRSNKYGGNALVPELLTLIADSYEFADDGASGILVNPRTQYPSLKHDPAPLQWPNKRKQRITLESRLRPCAIECAPRTGTYSARTGWFRTRDESGVSHRASWRYFAVEGQIRRGQRRDVPFAILARRRTVTPHCRD